MMKNSHSRADNDLITDMRDTDAASLVQDAKRLAVLSQSHSFPSRSCFSSELATLTVKLHTASIPLNPINSFRMVEFLTQFV